MSAEPKRRLTQDQTLTGGKVIGQAEVDEGAARAEYSTDNFYIAATDVHHNKSNVKMPDGKTLSMPRHIVAQVSELVEDDSTPYRTAFDLVRDGTVHRVHYLQARRANKNEQAWGAFRQSTEMEHRFAQAETHNEMVERSKYMIQTAMSRGDTGLLKETLVDAWALVPNLRSPYREELQSYLNGVAQLGQFPGSNNKL